MSASIKETGRTNSFSSGSKTYTSSTTHVAPMIEKVVLPTQVIEKPVAIHEEIRQEMIEEIQPVINVEKIKTEVHQVTQPLFDKEVKPVMIEKRVLGTEILNEVHVDGKGFRAADDHSTIRMKDSAAMVVEKPAIYTEVEKKQIIEEIQPVIYKETIVPTVIQETKPMYQKVVEGTVYSQETLAAKGIRSEEEMRREAELHAYRPSTEVVAPIHTQMRLPTQIVEKPAAIHEEIRKELIEEIQPVVEIEKLKTEVHQITAPLFDKEVKPVMIEKKVLATEIMPEVMVAGKGFRSADDHSTTKMLPTSAMVVEKPAIYTEVERRQVIEEIQPVIYKETVVPTVIQETKPMYQKVVEGTVYTQETLAAKGIRSEEEMRLEAERNAYRASNTVVAPIHAHMQLPTQVVEKPVAIHEEIRKEMVEEIQPVINVEKYQTEVHQVTQPLFDKEIKPVLIEKKVLATEVMPELKVEGRGFRAVEDHSTTKMLNTHTVVVEKAAQVIEIEKTQVIEEIQPVIYKETIVPTVIQETKPMYQKVVEGTVYSQETLAAKGIRSEEEIRREAEMHAYRPSTEVVAPIHTQMRLPTQVIEKPAAVHEEIRKELIEEIQPVVEIEKLKTEVHQITAPLFDKEVKPVMIEKRVLPTEIMSEVQLAGKGFRSAEDMSTTTMLPTTSMVVEKPAIYTEVERRQVIEEVQPVIYKETVIPTVIQETKPVYQKIVEGTVYSQETLAAKGIRSEEEMRREAEMNAYRPSTAVVAPIHSQMQLPTQIVEKPVAVHEEIRREMVEEIQPVINVEKFQTEVHQVTQPLFDKEVRPVMIEKRVLGTEILDEVRVEGRGVRAVEDVSTTRFLDTHTVVVEKSAQVIEIEKTQVIEEIQPVIYKETIVPTVIQETKPIFQRVVEGATYIHETLAPQSVAEWRAQHGEFQTTSTTTTTTVTSGVPQSTYMGSSTYTNTSGQRQL